MNIDNTVWYPPPAQSTSSSPSSTQDGSFGDALQEAAEENQTGAPTGFWALFANPAFPSVPQPDLTGTPTGFAALFGNTQPAEPTSTGGADAIAKSQEADARPEAAAESDMTSAEVQRESTSSTNSIIDALRIPKTFGMVHVDPISLIQTEIE